MAAEVRQKVYKVVWLNSPVTMRKQSVTDWVITSENCDEVNRCFTMYSVCMMTTIKEKKKKFRVTDY